MTGKEGTRISKKKIIDASWELMKEEGIEGFTMRKLAQGLNAQAASLYYYFENKQSIFQTLADQVAKETLASTRDMGNWKDQLNQFAFSLHERLTEYPYSAHLLMQTVPHESHYHSLNNFLLNIIDQVPMSDENKIASATCLLNYVISFELNQYEREKVSRRLGKNKQDMQNLFIQSIGSSDDGSKNALHRIYQNQNSSGIDMDRMFQIGLNIFISGIEQLTKT